MLMRPERRILASNRNSPHPQTSLAFITLPIQRQKNMNEENNILDEVEEIKTKNRRNFSTVVNKRKVSKYELDDFFMGG